MGDKTGIEWTDSTWNAVSGCTKVSPGCDHCYAETLAERFRGVPGHYYTDGFDLTLRPDKLPLPLRWGKPRRIFVNSMSDVFHADIPDDYIARMFAVMAASPTHTFQILTKRHARMRSLLASRQFVESVGVHLGAWSPITFGEVPRREPVVTWPLENVWLGVSVESQQWADIRIPALLGTPAAIRFLSMEPLLAPVTLRGAWFDYLDGWATESEHHPDCDGSCRQGCPVPVQVRTPEVDWVIVGGESGKGSRPMHPGWVTTLRDECVSTGTAFHFKQWGNWRPRATPDEAYTTHVRYDGTTTDDRAEGLGLYCMVRDANKNTRDLDGRTWDEFPDVAPHRATTGLVTAAVNAVDDPWSSIPPAPVDDPNVPF